MIDVRANLHRLHDDNCRARAKELLADERTRVHEEIILDAFFWAEINTPDLLAMQRDLVLWKNGDWGAPMDIADVLEERLPGLRGRVQKRDWQESGAGGW